MPTPIEEEIVTLKAAWDHIDDMVNFKMFTKPTTDKETNILPQTSTHSRLFNILLCDFLSQPNKPNPQEDTFSLPIVPNDKRYGANTTLLFQLQEVINRPQFGSNYRELEFSLKKFSKWLEGTVTVKKVWFPSINTEADIKVTRLDHLKITGNISKHHFTRLNHDTKKIQKILDQNGIKVSLSQAYTIIPEFSEWFFDHVFHYQMSEIAEMLNDIRWGIFSYLRNEFFRSFELYTIPKTNLTAYKFNYPESVHNELIKNIYWDLMNRLRSKPYFPKFQTCSSLKKDVI